MNFITKLLKKEKKLTIDFCEKNLDRFLTEDLQNEYNTFLSKKNIEYKEYHCQSRCEECKISPYAIVNGEFITAKDSLELLKMLKNLQKVK
ncbi:DUF1450 domain-containing protein [Neobacillus sp. 179-C4.2 HS]|uniref:DUF1450 domain-containing protein n=1 Tax=Neobacillus driksii TaxID=3035913 RepID=A0ABV4YQB0_9BACI|nr:DUF1450 domain-containing protein [Neobacillus sp. 179.-C4.2 HS]MDP5197733.1 DUF1450 domain-containing protein [Neobacillus sp. 179.-C4.2 HS]